MSPIVATILSLCLFESAPLPSGGAVHRVTLLGYELAGEGQVLDLAEVLDHAGRAPIPAAAVEEAPAAAAPAPEPAGVVLEDVPGLDVALVDEGAPPAPAEAALEQLFDVDEEAPTPAPAAEDLAPLVDEPVLEEASEPEQLQRTLDIAAELDCDVRVRGCLDCDMARAPGACTRCRGRGLRIWSNDVEVGPGFTPSHAAEYIAIAAALAERRPSLSAQADAGAGELLCQLLRRAPAGIRARATAWWDSGAMVADPDGDDIDVVNDAPAAAPPAPAPPAPLPPEPTPAALEPDASAEPQVQAAAALCSSCNGGRRRIRGGCERCQMRGVRVWRNNLEVAARFAWKPGGHAERIAVVGALADLLPTLPSEAMRGALDLLNVVLRDAEPDTRTHALRLWNAGREQIGAA
jgi:hypothetical protein